MPISITIAHRGEWAMAPNVDAAGKGAAASRKSAVGPAVAAQESKRQAAAREAREAEMQRPLDAEERKRLGEKVEVLRRDLVHRVLSKKSNGKMVSLPPRPARCPGSLAPDDCACGEYVLLPLCVLIPYAGLHQAERVVAWQVQAAACLDAAHTSCYLPRCTLSAAACCLQ